jgi:hypothetical protein
LHSSGEVLTGETERVQLANGPAPTEGTEDLKRRGFTPSELFGQGDVTSNE